MSKTENATLTLKGNGYDVIDSGTLETVLICRMCNEKFHTQPDVPEWALTDEDSATAERFIQAMDIADTHDCSGYDEDETPVLSTSVQMNALKNSSPKRELSKPKQTAFDTILPEKEEEPSALDMLRFIAEGKGN